MTETTVCAYFVAERDFPMLTLFGGARADEVLIKMLYAFARGVTESLTREDQRQDNTHTSALLHI